VLRRMSRERATSIAASLWVPHKRVNARRGQLMRRFALDKSRSIDAGMTMSHVSLRNRDCALGSRIGSRIGGVRQGNGITLSLNDAAQVQPHNVTVAAVNYRGSDALEVRLTGTIAGPDTDTFAFVPGLDFHDGTIEVDVARNAAPERHCRARAFRRDCVPHRCARRELCLRELLHPADQWPRRRPGSPQPFDAVLSPTPAMISTACAARRRASMSPTPTFVPGEWTHLRIEVSGATARLYVGAATQPTLIVRDLKRGADAHGTVGLFVDTAPTATPQFVRQAAIVLRFRRSHHIAAHSLANVGIKGALDDLRF